MPKKKHVERISQKKRKDTTEKELYLKMYKIPKWLFPKIGVPQNGWFIMENPLKWMLWGFSHIFGNTQTVFCVGKCPKVWAGSLQKCRCFLAENLCFLLLFFFGARAFPVVCLCNFLRPAIRSPLTVQQIQPLFISMMFSSHATASKCWG